jgi:hypothetical protein
MYMYQFYLIQVHVSVLLNTGTHLFTTTFSPYLLRSRPIKFNPHHLVLWSFLGLSQWVYVCDDMSKELKNYVSRSDQSPFILESSTL